MRDEEPMRPPSNSDDHPKPGEGRGVGFITAHMPAYLPPGVDLPPLNNLQVFRPLTCANMRESAAAGCGHLGKRGKRGASAGDFGCG